MQIVLLSHFPGRGGSSSFLKQLRAGLNSRGVDCSIVVGRDDPHPVLQDYHVVGGRSPLERRSSYLKQIEKLNPDIVFRISGIEEFDWLRFTPLPRVSHCFSFESHSYFSIPHLVRQTAKYVELWTGNTPDLSSLLKKAVGSPVPFQLLPYQISELFRRPANSPLDSASPVRIAYVGRLDSFQKQIERLPKIIRALHQRAPEVRWEIFGDGPEKAGFFKAVDSLGVGPIVTLHRWTSPEALSEALQNCHLFFLCSRWEGLPIAMVESMLSGLAPVVPSIPAGISQVVTPDVGWAYHPNTVSRAVRVLELAVKDLPALSARRLQAKARAEKMADPGLVSSQIDDLINRLEALSFNGQVESGLQRPPLRPLPLHQLPRAYAERALRRLRRLSA